VGRASANGQGKGEEARIGADRVHSLGMCDSPRMAYILVCTSHLLMRWYIAIDRRIIMHGIVFVCGLHEARVELSDQRADIMRKTSL
jgi:hypothetical protein